MNNRSRSTRSAILFTLLTCLPALALFAAAGSRPHPAVQLHTAFGQAEAAFAEKRIAISSKALAETTAVQLPGPWQVEILRPSTAHYGYSLTSAADSASFTLPGVLIGIFVVTVIAGLVSFTFLARRNNAAIHEAERVINQLSNGNLAERVVNSRADAVGSLGSAINRMAAAQEARTAAAEELAQAKNKSAEDRIRQLQDALAVSMGLQAPTGLADILDHSAKLLCDWLRCSHVAIYLLEGKMDTAHLRAAAGDAPHIDQAGPGSLVSASLKSGEVQTLRRSDHNLPSDAPFSAPAAEIVLPMKVGQDLIGVIDLHSLEASAFPDTEVQILQAISGQLAVAIQKAQHIARLEQVVQDLQASYRQFTQDEWLEFLRSQKETYALHLRGSRIETDPLMAPESAQSLAENRTIITVAPPSAGQDMPTGSSLAVPIQVRGQTIGALNIRFKTGKVTSETVQLVENITGRLAGALENARLLEVIEKRAERERRLAEITSRVRSSANIDQILQTALVELSRGLGVANAVIQLGDPTDNEAEGKW